jgi:SsrA-binding protein
MTDNIVATNRRARFEYSIYESLEAGIALTGTEVKSLRTGKASIANPDPLRPRKLLLHKREIKRLAEDVGNKKLTIIPLKAYFKGGIVKVEIGLAKGKKLYDKREAIKKRDSDREIKRISRSTR